jgi:hypothetical protein
MQKRSFRGSGEPVWVSLGPDPRRALGPAANPAAHMTAPDQCCSNVLKVLAKRRPHMTQSGHTDVRAKRLNYCPIHRFPRYLPAGRVKFHCFTGTAANPVEIRLIENDQIVGIGIPDNVVEFELDLFDLLCSKMPVLR